MDKKNQILLIDDDILSLKTAASLLQEYGYSVIACNDSVKALEMFQEKKYDLVMTDVKMPNMTGIELLEAICRKSPETPVILMTAYAEHDMAVDAIKKGAFDLIIKPYNPVRLFHSVQKALNFIALKEDISERKRTEESLRKTQAELVRTCSELKLVHEQALRNDKLASIGQLAAGVAHEINNPAGFIASNLGTLKKYAERLLTIITAQNDVLGRVAEPAESAELKEMWKTLKIDHICADLLKLIDESLDGTERIRLIVQNLKNFSRTDPAEYSDADLTICLESAINLVWNELKYKATLHKEYGNIPTIKCYPQQLSQVFVNLLVNAAHAIEQQGDITIRTWQEKDNIFITISDSGCGIPPENLNSIFEPFFTTKEPGKGTGLGLSIVNDIMKQHNGEISVDSKLGKGTSFTLRLPSIST